MASRTVISQAARTALDELVALDDPTIVGLVLSGSAARGMATERSDVDVYVVRADSAGRETSRSPELDEIPISLDELEEVPSYGASGWFFRWSFAYAQVLLDETGGRVTAAVRRQAVLTTGSSARS